MTNTEQCSKIETTNDQKDDDDNVNSVTASVQTADLAEKPATSGSGAVQARVSTLQLFKFATPLDWLLMLVGTLGAIGRGIVLPGFSLIFGDIIRVLFELETLKDDSRLWRTAALFLYFGALALVSSWLQVTCWMLAGERQVHRIRKHYMRAVLRQEVGWFDKEGANEIFSRISGDIVLINNAIADKFGSMIQFFAQFIAGFALGFYQGWLLSLVLLAAVPALAISGAIMMWLVSSLTTQGQKAYARAGAVAFEAINGIRTVAAFGGEEREAKKYDARLADARKAGIRKGCINGAGLGCTMLLINCAFALALWYGAQRSYDDQIEYCETKAVNSTICLADPRNYTLAAANGTSLLNFVPVFADGAFGNGTLAPGAQPIGFRDTGMFKEELFTGYDGGKVLTILFAVIFGAMSLGQMSPSLSAVSSGRGAAYVIYGTIERASLCDPFAPPADDASGDGVNSAAHEDKHAKVSTPAGKTLPGKVEGKIVLRDLHFAYPARPDVPILQGFSLKIRPGQTVALVGQSGCGKSTIVGLLERFYEPAQGDITVDGEPLTSLNVNWWRSQIGFVGQQPVLFSGTIAENIALGAVLSAADSVAFAEGRLKPVSQERIEAAARAANCHDFIVTFPHGYDTVIGAKGAQLSGGQKQRIAIARAFVRDPRIILLDEATSALDTRSEAVVQAALEKIMEGRTTIIIAHRLATIRDVDVIAVIENGRVVEKGSFDELVARPDSAFVRMARLQGLVNEHGEHDVEHAKKAALAAAATAADGAEAEASETDSDAPPPLPVTRAPDDGETGARPGDGDEAAAGDGKRLSLSRRLSLRLSGKDLDDAAAAAAATGATDAPKRKKGGKKAKKAGADKPAALGKKMSKTESKRVAKLEKLAEEGDANALAELQAEVQEGDASDDDVDAAETPSPYWRVYKLNRPETLWYIFGGLMAALNGIKDPVMSLIFTDMIATYYGDTNKIREGANLWSLVFVAIAVAVLFVQVLQDFVFAVGAERLTERIRSMTFRAILRQEVSFFDSKKTSAGVLATRLSQDAALVQGMFGAALGVTIQNVATAALGVGIAFYYGWQLTLVLLATVPILVAAQAMEVASMAGYGSTSLEEMAKATAIAAEAITEVRTVAANTSERFVMSRYGYALVPLLNQAKRRAFMSGLATGVSQGLMYATYTLNFWYGGTLIIDGTISAENMLNVFMAVLFSAMGIGQAMSLMPDAGKARGAAVSIFKLIDRKSRCDAMTPVGKPPGDKGRVVFGDVEFAYPSRKQQTVLRGLSVSLKPGETLALVGESGCGKSTTIGLIERFYEPQQGTVLVDGEPLPDIDVRRWRRMIGLVGQEPTLFTGTIRENIMYGVPDDEKHTVDDAKLQAAAMAANAHTFISKLPMGYDTFLGENGAQLSGGQKQRIAIARALIRDPKIILLDEATSALDSKSERIVQDALDRAMHNRTALVIAHRLSTIKHADRIAVVHKGRVVELGTHDELLAARGQYYQLVRRQTAEQ
jgi:ABC-type multidrug transport system fused ATPase/permease subunit